MKTSVLGTMIETGLAQEYPVHPTESKILNYGRLEKGWRYGMGEPIDESVVQFALALHKYALGNYIYDSDVFPTEDGELLLTLYSGSYLMDIHIGEDAVFDITIERDRVELYEHESISFEAVKKEILAFRKEVWNLRDLSTGNVTMQFVRGDTRARHFVTQVTDQEYPLSTYDVRSIEVGEPVTTYGPSTRFKKNRGKNLLYFGDSTSLF